MAPDEGPQRAFWAAASRDGQTRIGQGVEVRERRQSRVVRARGRTRAYARERVGVRVIVGGALLVVALVSSVLGTAQPAPGFAWDLPKGFPIPAVPADNPMSDAKVALGRHLFYDLRLSGNGAQSCATCHQQERAFTDGLATSAGSTGVDHPRNSMSLVNVAYAATLTWANPSLTRLEDQALVPMFGRHPIRARPGRGPRVARRPRPRATIRGALQERVSRGRRSVHAGERAQGARDVSADDHLRALTL